MAVFVFDGSSKKLVKIVERQGKYYVYDLRGVKEEGRAGFTFEWYKKYSAKWDYKPYEDNDVMSYPDPYFSEVKRWTPHLVRR